MKVLFHLGHPAHYHLFKNVISKLNRSNHETIILIKKKDVLEDLLIESGFEYLNILPEGRKDSKIGIALGLLKQDVGLLSYCLKNRPDLLVGTSSPIAHVGKLLNIRSYVVSEDDAKIIPYFAKLTFPFASLIISPKVCDNEIWEKKSLKYEGYHELAYLHPDHFTPEIGLVKKYIKTKRPYVILRFSSLGAHHDFGMKGIDDEMAMNMISMIEPFADVFISSERELSHQVEKYRLKINSGDIHHVMAFAKMCVGDSQTMAAESGVLGVPFIRYNDFVGKIGYLKELEEKYNLGIGIKAGEQGVLMDSIKQFLEMNDLSSVFKERKNKMLEEKINTADFLYNKILDARKK